MYKWMIHLIQFRKKDTLCRMNISQEILNEMGTQIQKKSKYLANRKLKKL